MLPVRQIDLHSLQNCADKESGVVSHRILLS